MMICARAACSKPFEKYRHHYSHRKYCCLKCFWIDKRKYTEDQLALFKRLVEEARPRDEIEKVTGIKRSNFKHIIRPRRPSWIDLGISDEALERWRVATRLKHPPEVRAEAVRLRKAGYFYKEIGYRLGLNLKQASALCRRELPKHSERVNAPLSAMRQP